MEPKPGERAPVLLLRDVHKSVREGGAIRTILAGADLELGAGEAVAVTGRSGAGKSTLLNVAAGLDRIDRGSVTLCGRDLQSLAEAERTALRRHRLGFVFQAFHLLPTLTVEENVALPLELAGKLDAAGRQRVRSLLERVGLGDRLAAFPPVLSGGEQQRVALARAVAHRPALLLCDEPTGNLDEESAAAVLGLLLELRAETGCSLLLATHDPEVAAVADRVVRLEHGRLGGAGR